MNKNLNEIGEVADSLDSLRAMLNVKHLSPEIHLESLKVAIPEASKRLKDAVVAETGENPWE